MHYEVTIVGAGVVGSLLAYSLAREGVHVCLLDLKSPHKIKKEERIFTGIFGRIRDVRQGPEGFLYLLTDEYTGRLIRVKPSSQ